MPTQTNEDVEKYVRQYLAIREILKKLDDAHDEARKEWVDEHNKLTGLLQAFMDAHGADSIKTSEGTCYNSTRYSASLADPQAFMNYVIEHSQWDLIDRKANATACRDFTAEKGAPPPGVNLSSLRTVGVRRPTR